MNILIVEDDILIAEMIKEIILELGHQVALLAYSCPDALESLKQKTFSIDMAILDIQLGTEKSGFTIASYLKEKTEIPFIFLTSYADKSIIEEALSYKPKAYLLKPFTKIELFTTLEIIQNQAENQSKFVSIKEGIKIYKLDVKDILWIKSDNVYLEVFTEEKKYLIRNSLDKFMKEVDDKRLKRVHRSYAINVNKIESVAGQHVVISQTEIPITRDARNEIITEFYS